MHFCLFESNKTNDAFILQLVIVCFILYFIQWRKIVSVMGQDAPGASCPMPMGEAVLSWERSNTTWTIYLINN